MNNRALKYTLAVFTGITVSSCSSQTVNTPATRKPPVTANRPILTPQKSVENKPPVNIQLPTVNREFRAAWVATVANINWPSKSGLSTDQQKAEAIKILDMLQQANFNAVIFQARPSADAFYKSDLEPWSYFLTGEAGRAPSPYYDPLEFWISEAHKRGMELHAWLNPYRAQHTSGGPVSNIGTAKKFPTETYRLRNGMYWLDPSSDKIQNHVSAVVQDLVKRYDLDAIHIDDYFYPYKEYNGGADFPDNPTWTTYLASGGTLSRADWRRANVNKFIKRLHDEIKSEKSWVKFGISPFGIWKPGNPEGITGSSQYDELYADAKLWLNEGWCDYFSPQLYWKEGGAQSYSALLGWWQQQNYRKIHLWPGLNTVGIKNVSDKPSEIVGQISTARRLLNNDSGVIHYSMDGISKNAAMLTALRQAYADKALVPSSPWMRSEAIKQPVLTVQKNGENISARWNSSQEPDVVHWVLFTRYGTEWSYEILNKNEITKVVSSSKAGQRLNTLAVKAVGRTGQESASAVESL